MLHLGCRTTERTTTTMWTARASAVTTARWKLPWLRPTHRRTTSRKATPENLQFYYHPTIWAAAATSPTWTERWYSTQSTCRSAKCSLKSGITSGIRLTSSTQKEFDEETGLYYYGARYYDSRLSLWMSTDPLEEKYPNISSYCYSNNNPIKYIDPDGNDWFVNDQNFYVWSMANYVPGFDYAGNLIPSRCISISNLRRNQENIIISIQVIFSSIGNFIFGKNSFIEKKAYSHAEESFNNELIYQGATIIPLSIVGRMGKTILAAFKASSKSVWSLPWLEHWFNSEEQLGKNLKISR